MALSTASARDGEIQSMGKSGYAWCPPDWLRNTEEPGMGCLAARITPKAQHTTKVMDCRRRCDGMGQLGPSGIQAFAFSSKEKAYAWTPWV